jgi:hypothetical protein
LQITVKELRQEERVEGKICEKGSQESQESSQKDGEERKEKGKEENEKGTEGSETSSSSQEEEAHAWPDLQNDN